jgi:hypothetical protein
MNGSAKKGKLDYFQPQMGENRIRILGDIVPRYVYWVQGPDKKIPVECLEYDRESERFVGGADPVRDMFPDLGCQWAYTSQVFDYSDNKIKVFVFKKSIFEDILKQVKNAKSPFYNVDPTCPETGFDVVFNKEKDGPKVYNVSYTLDPFGMSSSVGKVGDEVTAQIDAGNLKPIEELFPRPTVEDVKTSLDRIMNFGKETNQDDSADKEAVDELD